MTAVGCVTVAPGRFSRGARTPAPHFRGQWSEHKCTTTSIASRSDTTRTRLELHHSSKTQNYAGAGDGRKLHYVRRVFLNWVYKLYSKYKKNWFLTFPDCVILTLRPWTKQQCKPTSVSPQIAVQFVQINKHKHAHKWHRLPYHKDRPRPAWATIPANNTTHLYDKQEALGEYN